MVLCMVDMDVVGVMTAYLLCTAQSREALSRLCSTYTHQGKYAAITPTTFIISTDTIEPLL